MLLYICVCLKIDCSDQKLDLFATSSFPISPTSEHSQKTENFSFLRLNPFPNINGKADKKN